MECTQNRSENMSEKVTTEKDKTKKAESLPEGWKRVRLGEVIEDIGDGGTPPRDDHRNFGGSINWVVIDDIQKRIYRTAETLTEEGLKHSNAKVWKKGAVILSFGATIGEVGIAEVELATKQGIAGIIPKDQVLINIFLYYILKYKKNTLLGLANQTTLKEVRPNVIKEKVDFLLPPLPEQRKIAEILETVDNAIEKTDAIIEKYRRIKKGLMADLLTGKIRLIPYGHSEAEGEESPLLTSPEAKKFVIGNKTFVAVPNQKWKNTPIGKIPEDWEVAKMNSIIKEGLINGIWGEEPKDYENVYPILRSTEITHSGKIETETVEFRKVMLERSKISKYVLRNGDILIVSSSGSEELIGRVAIFKDSGNETFLFSNFLLRLRVGETTSHMYIFYFLSSFWYQSFLAKFQETSTGLRNFPKNEFLALLFPLPPLPEQQLIADVLSEVDEVIEKEIQYKEKLERIKKGLMEDLLTGKVRVNNLIKEDIQNDTKIS
jgi:type I restriction enzyme S subunit